MWCVLQARVYVGASSESASGATSESANGAELTEVIMCDEYVINAACVTNAWCWPRNKTRVGRQTRTSFPAQSRTYSEEALGRDE